MQSYIRPDKANWQNICKRPALDFEALDGIVSKIVKDIAEKGDAALINYTEQFDKIKLEQILQPDQYFLEAEKLVSNDLKLAINTAAKNIKAFHKAQLFNPIVVETMPGVKCWQKAVPIEKVGLYVPGGTAPLFSTVLMLGIPASLSGCSQIVLCTPPMKNGKVHPAVLYAARIAGVTDVFAVGGIQSIAAMALGTFSIPKVYKIFGPGNQYVTAAKQYVSRMGVAIDMPAGPSEVAVMADSTANPASIAADMLSQAEHGNDSQALLITNSDDLVEKVKNEIAMQSKELSRQNYIHNSLQSAKIVVLNSVADMIEFTNEYAPEHLIISMKDYAEVADKISNAGSVFLGYFTPESAGDYASGTNHTLPTNGYAKAYSGVNMDSFIKKITYQELDYEGLMSLSSTITCMANEENLTAHANAVNVRIKK